MRRGEQSRGEQRSSPVRRAGDSKESRGAVDDLILELGEAFGLSDAQLEEQRASFAKVGHLALKACLRHGQTFTVAVDRIVDQASRRASEQRQGEARKGIALWQTDMNALFTEEIQGGKTRE